MRQWYQRGSASTPGHTAVGAGAGSPRGLQIPLWRCLLLAQRVEGRKGRPTWGWELPDLQLLLPLQEEAGGEGRDKIKQPKGVVALRRNNLFFMSLFAFVKLSKQKFMPFVGMH